MRLFFLLICGGLFTVSLQAQLRTPKSALKHCGVTERGEWIDAYQRGEIAAVRSSDVLVLPLRLHIVGTSNGDGYASWNSILAAINLLQEDFSGTNLVFYLDGEIDFINNSSYYRHNASTGAAMMALNNDANVINVYIVDDPADACGYYSPSRDAIALANSCLGGSDHTLGHEMGHFLSLPHTFDGWEGELEESFDNLPTESRAPSTVGGRLVEKVDGSNCAEAGDGFCDTPPDYVSERWSCDFSGFYPDSLLDPDSVKFAVPGYPIMGYANDACVESFTDEQAAAMTTNANGRGGLQRDVDPDDAPADPDLITLLESSGNIDVVDEIRVPLRWTSTPNSDYYLVQISRSPFFGTILHDEFITKDTFTVLTPDNDIEVGTRYYWRIQPVNRFNVLSSGTDAKNFRITGIVSSVQDATLDAGLTVSPNPVAANRGFLSVALTGAPLTEAVELEMISTTGQRIYRHREPNGVSVRWTHDVPVADLASGVYFLRLRGANRFVTRRIIVSQ